jgi:hypothetical protein
LALIQGGILAYWFFTAHPRVFSVFYLVSNLKDASNASITASSSGVFRVSPWLRFHAHGLRLAIIAPVSGSARFLGKVDDDGLKGSI